MKLIMTTLKENITELMCAVMLSQLYNFASLQTKYEVGHSGLLVYSKTTITKCFEVRI
jgi:hypothetical protein